MSLTSVVLVLVMGPHLAVISHLVRCSRTRQVSCGAKTVGVKKFGLWFPAPLIVWDGRGETYSLSGPELTCMLPNFVANGPTVFALKIFAVANILVVGSCPRGGG